eukprot:jgi/Bigna1/143918/aug1.82_g18626
MMKKQLAGGRLLQGVVRDAGGMGDTKQGLASLKSARSQSTKVLATALRPLVEFTEKADNSFISKLKEEEIPEKLDPRRPREVKGAHFTRVDPEPVPNPYLVGASPSCAQMLGLDPKELDSDEFLQVFSGNELPKGFAGWASVYGCHCGGQWFGQLGDGRAMSIGEVMNPTSSHRYELQLKGCGRTPYSRQFDGRAGVLSFGVDGSPWYRTMYCKRKENPITNIVVHIL